MNKRCKGCGAVLQCDNEKKIGYVPKGKEESLYCERCFKITNYNQYKMVNLANINDKIIEEINKKASFVYFMIDFLNISEETMVTYKKINVLKKLVVTKIDIVPKNIRFNKIIKWLSHIYKIEDDIILVSTKKNINSKLLINQLLENKIKECYVVGYTNSGKSTLINYLTGKNEITTSLVSNTTLDFIPIKLNDDLKIIDSPGFTYNNCFLDCDDYKILKKISVNSVIKPVIYQVKEISHLIIEDKIRINSSFNNIFVIYMSNNLSIKRVFPNNHDLMDLDKVVLNIDDNSDIVIKGLGFINIKKKCVLTVYTDKKDLFEVRTSLFGS